MFRFNTLRLDPNGEGTAAPAASEGNPADPAGSEAGSSSEGAGAGSPAAGSLAAEGGQQPTVDWEARARSFQSRADRAEAELQRARQALAVEQPQQAGEERPLTEASLHAYLDRRSAIDRVVSQVPQRYRFAHPMILQRAYEYESAEALQAALEESHSAEAEYRERIRQEVAKELGVDAGAGTTPPSGDPRPPATANGAATGAAGPPTVQQLAKMSQGELDAVEQQYPGHIQSALMGAEQDTIYTG